jgi:hypothetical protein
MMRVTWLRYWTTKSICHPVSLTENKRRVKYMWVLTKHCLVQKVADSAQNMAFNAGFHYFDPETHIKNFKI